MTLYDTQMRVDDIILAQAAIFARINRVFRKEERPLEMARRPLMNVKDSSEEEEEVPAKTAQIERLRSVISAVNHDLRQPLQTMELLCGVLTAKTKDEEVLKINTRIEDTLRSAIDLLDSLVNAERSAELAEEHAKPVTKETPVSVIEQPPATEVVPSPTISIVDDDRELREAMGDLLRSRGYAVQLYESCEDFLARRVPTRPGALLIDAVFPSGMSGLDLLKRMKEIKQLPPAIMVTGRGDISLAVDAMKAGAVDFVEKPINHKELLQVAANVFKQTQDATRVSEDREVALARLSRLSARERQVMEMVLQGQLNKNIAADLGISQRTVETHRANIMRKMEVKSLPALLRLTMAAA